MIATWDQVRKDFREVRPILFEALDAFYKSVEPKRRSQLTVALSEYYYGEKIIEDGTPYWPGETPPPPEFIIAQGLPLGFILENSCEILEYVVGGATISQVSQALLPPGEAIGLFEMTDALTDMPNPKAPDWHITAGATSIHTLHNLGTQQNINRLEKALGESIDAFSFQNMPYLTDQLKSLAAFDRIRRNWRVRIAYFPRSWFDELLARYNEGPASTLVRILLRQAWKSVARVRIYHSNLLHERLRVAAKGGGARNHMAAAAASALITAENVLAARRPCYTPRRTDCMAGPFGAIADEIIGVVGPENWVIAPAYLENEVTVGYLKLEHAAPQILDGVASRGMKDKVTEMMSILKTAAHDEAKNRSSKFEVAFYVRLADRLMFQTPSTRSAGADTKPSVYRMAFDERLVSVRPLALTQKEFYHPLFSTLPNERCPFFRNAIRIEVAPKTAPPMAGEVRE